jgi:hypothetical protein
MIVLSYYSSNVAIHIELFSYIFLLYSVILENFTIVFKICLGTITCKWDSGLFNYGCESNLALGFLLNASTEMYFTVVYRVLNTSERNNLLVLHEQSVTLYTHVSLLIAVFKCQQFSDSLS